MSYYNRLVVLAIFGFVLMSFSLTANAQLVPSCAIPLADIGLPVAYGNVGNGITNTFITTSGSGNVATTDSFVNNFLGQNVVQGLGGPFGGWGCGPCGFGGAGGFASTGPFQTGVGGNIGAQSSEACGSAGSSSFGLQPIGLAFGIPVAGPSGLLYT
jgi:hypothetical protein